MQTMKKSLTQTVLLGIVVMILAACAPSVVTQTPTPEPVRTEQPVLSNTQEAEESGSTEVGQSTAVTAATEEAPGLPFAPEPGFDLGDPNLKATDPAGFVQAAGRLQLVELFAFW